MTNDLGVWTADDCALVLIDYRGQVVQFLTGGFGEAGRGIGISRNRIRAPSAARTRR